MHPSRRSIRQHAIGGTMVFVIGISTSIASAVNLPPGGNTPLSGAAGGTGGGTVIHDGSVPVQVFSGGGALLFDGILQDRVVRVEATGTLSFNRLIRDTNGSLNGAVVELACSNYASFLTDVEYSTTSTGTVTPQSASRTATGAVVAFHYDETPIYSGTESKFADVLTEALEFDEGGRCVIRLQTGEEVAVPVVSPARRVEPGCRHIDFEDIPVGTTFPVGASFSSNGVLMHVEEFYFNLGACSNAFAGGLARVQANGDACGDGNELNVGNVNVRFDYGEPLLAWSVRFGEFGGNVNLTVNGQCISVNNFSDLPPLVGGVMVTVDESNPGQGCGKLTLEGPIHDVAIGGQEFVIDDVECYPDICFDDDTPPVAELSAPSPVACVCDPVEIIGTATDANFEQYVLQYRFISDSTWYDIAVRNTPVVADVLGLWSTTGLTQGYYLIRLTVRDQCGHAETAVNLVWLGTQFDNLTVREPDNGDIVGRRVCIDGTVWDRYCFDGYSVEYQPAGAPGWAPVDPAYPIYTATVINDPIASWDTIGLGVPDGDYNVRVRASDTCGHTAMEQRAVVVDNTPPLAILTSPEPCSYVQDDVFVYGTAADANLASWVLQYTGGDASGWVTIASGNSPVVDDLLAIWDTSSLRPCAYTLRLVVTDRAVLDCNSAIHHRSEYTVSVNVGTCGDFDVDDDGDVDLFDYNAFENAFTGPMP